MSKAKPKSKARAVKKTRKRGKRVAPARAITQATAEPPQSLLRTPERKKFSMPFLLWANVPFAMMDMWFDAYGPKRDRM